MRIFFLSTMQDTCGINCRWRTCPQRYLVALRRIEGLCNIETLSEVPRHFSRIPEKSPKNGDLVILYAKDSDDLDMMVSAREAFDGLKKILVVADTVGADDRKYHLLEPRFITQGWRDVAELEAVIHKMAGSVR